MARTIPSTTTTSRTKPSRAPVSGGDPYKEWVALDLTAAKWAAIGGNVTNNWAVTNSGGNLVITAGIAALQNKHIEKNGAGNGSVGSNHNDGLALVYKAHLDCTPGGAPSGVTADTFWGEYTVIAVKMTFGQVGTASTATGYGIGGNEADDSNPWGTSGSKGTKTRAGVGFAHYSSTQSGNPTALPTCDSTNNFAQVIRVQKDVNQPNGKCSVKVMSLGPNDGATPALMVNGQTGGTSNRNDANFAHGGSILLREGTGDTTDIDTLVMQQGGFPTTAKSGSTNDSNSDGSVVCWVENSANDATLPTKATGPMIVTENANTDLSRYLGSFVHPMILIDQNGNTTYSGTERAHVVISQIQVLVQPLRGRKDFP